MGILPKDRQNSEAPLLAVRRELMVLHERILWVSRVFNTPPINLGIKAAGNYKNVRKLCYDSWKDRQSVLSFNSVGIRRNSGDDLFHCKYGADLMCSGSLRHQ